MCDGRMCAWLALFGLLWGCDDAVTGGGPPPDATAVDDAAADEGNRPDASGPDGARPDAAGPDGGDCPGADIGEPCDTGLFGVCAAGTTACVDGEPACRPAAEPADETCDGLDNDCNGDVDDAPGVGGPCVSGIGACEGAGVLICDLEVGRVVCAIEPGELLDEVCDGIDNDCDGPIDEDVPPGALCVAGVGACAVDGFEVCVDGARVCDAVALPAGLDELCGDGFDDDCDGETDEPDCVTPCEADADCAPGETLCEAGACVPGQCRVDGDCPGLDRCADQACVPGGCGADDACPPGAICVDGGCLRAPDSDGDGVVDLRDLDDDDDGIADWVECRFEERHVVANGSFEHPGDVPDGEAAARPIAAVPGWQSGDETIDVFAHGFDGIAGPDGRQWAAAGDGLLRQPVETAPQSIYEWTVLHRGADGGALRVQVGPPGAPEELARRDHLGDRWRAASGTWRAPAGQAASVFRLAGVGAGPHYVDGVRFAPRCALDTDGDGIPNRLDLDSDGDGRPDAEEAGHGVPARGGVIVGERGDNGLGDALETAADAGDPVFLPADRDGDGVPDFLQPGPYVAERCDNGEDDDFDALVDCADADCAHRLACRATAECPPEPNNGFVNASPTAPAVYGDCVIGGANDRDLYAVEICAGGRLRVTLEAADGADLDLTLFDADRDLLERRATEGAGETLTFTTGPARAVFIGVDPAAADTAGPYTLSIEVACGEYCDGGEDEDGDGDVDCLDLDCAGDPACAFEPTVFFSAPRGGQGDLPGTPTRLYRLDADGRAAVVGEVELDGQPLAITAIAMHPDGRLFGFAYDVESETSTRVSIDPETAVARAPGAPFDGWIMGAAFDAARTLWILDRSTQRLGRYADGALAEPLVALPGSWSGGDIAFDGQGRCYVTGTEGVNLGRSSQHPVYRCDLGGDGLVEYASPRPVGFVSPDDSARVPAIAFALSPTDCRPTLYGFDGSLEDELARIDLGPYTTRTQQIATTGINYAFFTNGDAAGFPDIDRRPACAGVEVCDDGVDNDGDGDVDCRDAQCTLDVRCRRVEGVCDDGVDNDLDFAADCADVDCADDPACWVPRACVVDEDCPAAALCQLGRCIGLGGRCAAPLRAGFGQFAGSTAHRQNLVGEATCVEGSANEAVYVFTPEADGRVCLSTRGSRYDTVLFVRTTCADPDTEVVCNDDIDGDTAASQITLDARAGTDYFVIVDGRPPERGGYVLDITPGECGARGVETCDNGVDDDGNGAADCFDFACLDAAPCALPTEAACDDGSDDDGDGRVDCHDLDCRDDPACDIEPSLYYSVVRTLRGDITAGPTDLYALDTRGRSVRVGPLLLDGRPATISALALDAEGRLTGARDIGGEAVLVDIDRETGAVQPIDGRRLDQSVRGLARGASGALYGFRAFTIGRYVRGNLLALTWSGLARSVGDIAFDAHDHCFASSYRALGPSYLYLCIADFVGLRPIGQPVAIGFDEGPGPEVLLSSMAWALDAETCAPTLYTVDIAREHELGVVRPLSRPPELQRIAGLGLDLPATPDSDLAGFPSVANTPSCEGRVEICDNGADDDGDGAVDCDDAGCLLGPGCVPPADICGNGLDDDLDGPADCDDADCADDPACAP